MLRAGTVDAPERHLATVDALLGGTDERDAVAQPSRTADDYGRPCAASPPYEFTCAPTTPWRPSGRSCRATSWRRCSLSGSRRRERTRLLRLTTPLAPPAHMAATREAADRIVRPLAEDAIPVVNGYVGAAREGRPPPWGAAGATIPPPSWGRCWATKVYLTDVDGISPPIPSWCPGRGCYGAIIPRGRARLFRRRRAPPKTAPLAERNIVLRIANAMALGARHASCRGPARCVSMARHHLDGRAVLVGDLGMGALVVAASRALRCLADAGAGSSCSPRALPSVT